MLTCGLRTGLAFLLRRALRVNGFILASMRIEGKTALITGGASGLGAASARMIVENGGRVVIADLKPGADLGEAAVFAHTDVTDPSQMQSAIERFDRLHILINCAGIGDP